MSDDRADVAGQKIFIFADAEDERTPAACADNEIWDVCVHHGDAVCANYLL